MGATPVYAFPYPEPPDAADGPFALQTLANAVEAEVIRIWQSAEDVRYLMLNRPAYRARRTIALNIPTGVDTEIPMDTVDVNTLGAVRPQAWYLCSWGVNFSPNAAGMRASALRVNGAVHPIGRSDPAPMGSASYVSQIPGRTLLLNLVPSDIVTVTAFHNSGAPLAIRNSPTADQCYLLLIHVAGPLPSGFPP